MSCSTYLGVLAYLEVPASPNQTSSLLSAWHCHLFRPSAGVPGSSVQDLKSEHVLLHLTLAIQPPSLDGDRAAPLQAGSLLDALHSRAPPSAHHPVRLDWVARVRIAAQVARGLDELHEANLTHGAVRAKSFAWTLGTCSALSVLQLGCVLLHIF